MADQDELTLRIKTDQASIQQARQAVASTRAEIDNMRKAVTDLDAAGAQMAKVARDIASANQAETQSLLDLEKSVTRNTEAYDRYADAKKKAAESTPDFNDELSNGGGGGRIGGAQGLFRAASRFSGDAAFGEAGAFIRIGEEFNNTLKETGGSFGAILTSAGPLVGILSGIAVGINLLKKASEEATKQFAAQYDGALQTIELAKRSTTEELKIKRDAAKLNLDIAKAQADGAKQFFDGAIRDIKASTNIFQQAGLGAQRLLDIGQGADLNKASDAVKTTKDALDKAQASFDAINVALKSTDVATNDATQAEKKLAEARYNTAQASIDQQVKTDADIRKLMRDGSEKQRADMAQGIQDELDSTKDLIDAQYKLAKQFEGQPEIYNQISAKIQQLQEHQTDLQHSYDALTSATIKAYVASNDAAKAEEKKQQELANIGKKYADDTVKIEQEAAQAKADAAKKYADQQVQIAEQAAEQAENALQKYQDDLAKLGTDLARQLSDDERKAAEERLKAQIDEQRQEAKAARDHADALRKIQRDAAKAEKQAIDDRDFARLFDIRDNTKQQIDEENERYVRDQQERQIAYNDQLADMQRAQEVERQQRIADYQQKLVDLQAAYAREQAQIDANRKKTLDKAQQAYTQEQNLLVQRYTNEQNIAQQAAINSINLLNQTEAQKLQIQAAYAQAIMQMYQNAVNQLGGTTAAGAVPPSITSGFGAAGGNSYNVTVPTNVNASNMQSAQQIGAATAQQVRAVVLSTLQEITG